MNPMVRIVKCPICGAVLKIYRKEQKYFNCCHVRHRIEDCLVANSYHKINIGKIKEAPKSEPEKPKEGDILELEPPKEVDLE